MSKTLIYRGRKDGVESDAVEHDGHTLRLGVETEVPDDVAKHLTTGENGKLYEFDTPAKSGGDG